MTTPGALNAGMVRAMAALYALRFALRCWLCELLISWALKVSPPGYSCSAVQCVVDAVRDPSRFKPVTPPGGDDGRG